MTLYLPGIEAEKIIECVPNFSEGRKPEVLAQIVDAISSVPQVIVLDYQMDPDHNRAVVTFIGSPQAVIKAAFQATKVAADLIDLTRQHGEHPRFGATDVIPLVPINGVTMEECVTLAEELGKKIASKLDIPVYLYEKAARKPERENLASIRNKNRQFEQLRELIHSDPNWAPDFGPRRVHPTAGATIIGVRKILIAYNVNLGTSDVEIAKKIARNVRFSGGGLRNVKALGFELKERGIAQVSMNLVNHEETPPHRAFELIKTEAKRYGVPIVGSEIIGLIPLKAILDATDFYLRLENYPMHQVLDLKVLDAITKHPLSLKNSKISHFLDEIAASKPAPGAGSMAALNGALAAAAFEKAILISMKKKTDGETNLTLKNLNNEIKHLRMELTRLIDEDALTFSEYMIFQKKHKNLAQQKDLHDDNNRKRVLWRIIQVPLDVARACRQLLHLMNESLELINEDVLSEALAAASNAQAGAKIAITLARINLTMVSNQNQNSNINDELQDLEKDVDALQSVLLSNLQKRLQI